jgi:hypothetical protein
MYLIYTKKIGVFLQRRFRIKVFNPPQFFHLELGWFGFWINKSGTMYLEVPKSKKIGTWRFLK